MSKLLEATDPHSDVACDEALKFRILCQAAFDGILVHDGGTIIEASDTCAAMFGTTPDELLGHDVFDLTAPEKHELLGQHIRFDISTPFESVARRMDGTRFDVEVCGVSVPGTAKRIVALRDLSARRLAERSAAESQDRYRDLVENSHELIGTHDLEGRILSTNPAFCRALGEPSEALIGRMLPDFLVDPGRFADYLETMVRDGVASGVLSIRAADGTQRIWEYRNTLRRDGVAKPIVRGMARDITEQTNATRALSHSEELFRSMIESISDFISIITPTGQIRYPSPSVEPLLGYSREALTGRPFVELVHPEDAAAAVYFFDAQRAHGSASDVIALRLRHASGAWRHFEVAATNVLHNGNVTAIVATARDITDRKLLEKQLEQAQRLTSLGRLAATVAHEFNNVLMGMAPFAELMQRPEVKPDLVTRGARHIATSVARGKRIVQDLLRFTQPAEPDLKPLNLASWWESLGSEMRAMVPNNVQILAQLPPAASPVVADASQLAQVFANLVANARDAMPKGGTLTIHAEQPGPDATYPFGLVQRPEAFTHLTIADTGAGIPPEFINQIFDPLFTTKTSGGTGLGLAVAHQVITRAGGYIFVESRPGRGATFHIFLRNAAEPVPPHQATVSPRVITARRLLMVEDEVAIIEGVGDLLTELGVTFESVTTGEEAAGAVGRFHPDIVLMDVTLPGIDGLEAYRRIRRDHPRLPFVFATGHGDGSKISGMLGDRRTRFLQKPFDLAVLLDAIADLESQPS